MKRKSCPELYYNFDECRHDTVFSSERWVGVLKNSSIKAIKNSLSVILGTVLLAFGISVFQLPFDLVSGGMSGLAIVLAKIPGPSFLTVDFYVLVMTWGLFLLGLIILGRAFAMKTLISTIVYPPAFSLFARLADAEVLGGILNLRNSPHGDAAIIVAAVFSGIITGVGIALAFLGGGSTGGIDIPAICISRKVKKLTSAQIILIIDASIILAGVFVIGDLAISLLGIVSSFVSSVVTDKIFSGSTKAFTANIVSDKYEDINKAVIEKINRTTTLIDCVGGYSREKKHMLTVTFNMSEYSALLTAVLDADKNAFISISKAHEINGEGWTYD